MRSDLATSSVLVTGGTSGLGAALCQRLVGLGATVTSLDRRASTKVPTIETDLADTAAATDATFRAVERMGSVDAVVCCAGTDSPGALGAIGREEWDRILGVNLLGAAAVIRAALPQLITSRGRVVTVASTLGHRAVADATAYCASKFGIVGFTRALAAECKGQVGVTLLTPGGMDTAFFDARDEQYKPPSDAVLADPGDVADAIVWALDRPQGIEVRELAVMTPTEGSWP